MIRFAISLIMNDDEPERSRWTPYVEGIFKWLSSQDIPYEIVSIKYWELLRDDYVIIRCIEISEQDGVMLRLYYPEVPLFETFINNECMFITGYLEERTYD